MSFQSLFEVVSCITIMISPWVALLFYDKVQETFTSLPTLSYHPKGLPSETVLSTSSPVNNVLLLPSHAVTEAATPADVVSFHPLLRGLVYYLSAYVAPCMALYIMWLMGKRITKIFGACARAAKESSGALVDHQSETAAPATLDDLVASSKAVDSGAHVAVSKDLIKEALLDLLLSGDRSVHEALAPYFSSQLAAPSSSSADEKVDREILMKEVDTHLRASESRVTDSINRLRSELVSSPPGPSPSGSVPTTPRNPVPSSDASAAAPSVDEDSSSNVDAPPLPANPPQEDGAVDGEDGGMKKKKPRGTRAGKRVQGKRERRLYYEQSAAGGGDGGSSGVVGGST